MVAAGPGGRRLRLLPLPALSWLLLGSPVQGGLNPNATSKSGNATENSTNVVDAGNATDNSTDVVDAPTDLPCDLSAFNLTTGLSWGQCVGTTLGHDQTCTLDCTPGFAKASPTTQLSCSNGTLTGNASCVPGFCAVADRLPLGGGLGNCTAALAFNHTCQPACPFGSILEQPMACSLGGDLTKAVCVVVKTVSCPAGQRQRPEVNASCEECPLGQYKTEEGPGPCTPCPLGATTEKFGQTLESSCICNGTSFTDSSTESEPDALVCTACPNNSMIEGNNNKFRRKGTINDCQCEEGYLREPTDLDETLKLCRLPSPCDARDWVLKSNLTVLTDNGPHRLMLGTCAEFLNGTDKWMPHEKTCKFYCSRDRAPQLAANWLAAASTQLRCTDGKTEGPTVGTWCSEQSFEIPPLVFLTTMTVVSIAAGVRMEMRQRSFEKNCVNEMKSRLPSLQERVTSRRSHVALAKVKEA